MPKIFFAAFRLRYSYLVFSLVLAAAAAVGGVYYVHRNLPVPALVALGLDDLTIVVDAGHGGADPGAVGVTGTLEKEVDLAIANRLADLLESSGVEVIQTREMDEMIAKNKTEDIHKRAEIACEAQANLFITVHANSIPQKNLQGAQVFYHPDSPEGCRLAGNIQDEIRRVMGNTNRKILAKNDIFLLNHLAIPAVLVEVGFLSNQEEEALLQDPEYQNRMAWCIYSGLVNFLAGDRNIMDSFVKDGESAGASIRMQ